MNHTQAQPKSPFRRPALAALALLVAPSMTSCVSEAQMRLAVEDRDREIATLRSDKTELQERLSLLQYEKEDLRIQLESAQSGAAAPIPASFEAEEAPSYVNFPELEAMGITTDQRAGETVISVPAEVTFASGKATLSTKGRDALGKVASRMRSEFPADARFYIEGHTDSDPIRKSGFGSNRELSIARAMAVLTFLVESGNVPDDRCVVVGHGQYEPIAPNNGNQKAKNRRVEIVVKSN